MTKKEQLIAQAKELGIPNVSKYWTIRELELRIKSKLRYDPPKPQGTIDGLDHPTTGNEARTSDGQADSTVSPCR